MQNSVYGVCLDHKDYFGRFAIPHSKSGLIVIHKLQDAW